MSSETSVITYQVTDVSWGATVNFMVTAVRNSNSQFQFIEFYLSFSQLLLWGLYSSEIWRRTVRYKFTSVCHLCDPWYMQVLFLSSSSYWLSPGSNPGLPLTVSSTWGLLCFLFVYFFYWLIYLPPRSWWQYSFPKHPWTSSRLHGVVLQMNVILIYFINEHSSLLTLRVLFWVPISVLKHSTKYVNWNIQTLKDLTVPLWSFLLYEISRTDGYVGDKGERTETW